MSSPALQDIISAVLPVLRMERGISAWRRQSAEAIALCRTGAFGTFRVECPDGHEGFTLNKACWNRNCRGCSAIKTERWVNQRDAQKLDCPHHHAVFTTPDKLHPIFRFNERIFSDVLFHATKHTLLTLLAEDEHCGGQPGILTTLHTWGQTLQTHVHAHVIVTAGGLGKDGKWKPAKKPILIHDNLLSDFFRGAFLRMLEERYEARELKLPPDMDDADFKKRIAAVRKMKWKVKVMERFDDPTHVIRYLAHYLRGGPIGNSRIEDFDGEQVTFRFKNNRIKDMHVPKQSTTTMRATAFVRRFLSHVPPKGYQVVRGYGLYANTNLRRKLEVARKALGQKAVERPDDATFHSVLEKKGRGDEARCSVCKKPYVYVYVDDRFKKDPLARIRRAITVAKRVEVPP